MMKRISKLLGLSVVIAVALVVIAQIDVVSRYLNDNNRIPTFVATRLAQARPARFQHRDQRKSISARMQPASNRVGGMMAFQDAAVESHPDSSLTEPDMPHEFRDSSPADDLYEQTNHVHDHADHDHEDRDWTERDPFSVARSAKSDDLSKIKKQIKQVEREIQKIGKHSVRRNRADDRLTVELQLEANKRQLQLLQLSTERDRLRQHALAIQKYEAARRAEESLRDRRPTRNSRTPRENRHHDENPRNSEPDFQTDELAFNSPEELREREEQLEQETQRLKKLFEAVERLYAAEVDDVAEEMKRRARELQKELEHRREELHREHERVEQRLNQQRRRNRRPVAENPLEEVLHELRTLREVVHGLRHEVRELREELTEEREVESEERMSDLPEMGLPENEPREAAADDRLEEPLLGEETIGEEAPAEDEPKREEPLPREATTDDEAAFDQEPQLDVPAKSESSFQDAPTIEAPSEAAIEDESASSAPLPKVIRELTLLVRSEQNRAGKRSIRVHVGTHRPRPIPVVSLDQTFTAMKLRAPDLMDNLSDANLMIRIDQDVPLGQLEKLKGLAKSSGFRQYSIALEPKIDRTASVQLDSEDFENGSWGGHIDLSREDLSHFEKVTHDKQLLLEVGFPRDGAGNQEPESIVIYRKKNQILEADWEHYFMREAQIYKVFNTNPKDITIVIRVERDVTHDKLVKIVELIRGTGFGKISVATRPLEAI